MAWIDVRRRDAAPGIVVPVTAAWTATQTAAYFGHLQINPPFEVYKIKAFDIRWWTSTACTEQNSIDFGVMNLATNNALYTAGILNGTGGAWTIATCSAIGSLASTVYEVRARPRTVFASQAAPYNIIPPNSGLLIFPLQSTATSTSTNTITGGSFASSTAYDFKPGLGGDSFSLYTADNRVKSGQLKLGYVPAIRITQAAKTDCFQRVECTVYFEGVSALGGPQP